MNTATHRARRFIVLLGVIIIAFSASASEEAPGKIEAPLAERLDQAKSNERIPVSISLAMAR